MTLDEAIPIVSAMSQGLNINPKFDELTALKIILQAGIALQKARALVVGVPVQLLPGETPY